MKFIIDDKEIEGELFVYSEHGFWMWKSPGWESIPIIDIYDFKAKAEDQLLKHPDYLDLNEILKPS